MNEEANLIEIDALPNWLTMGLLVSVVTCELHAITNFSSSIEEKKEQSKKTKSAKNKQTNNRPIGSLLRCWLNYKNGSNLSLI